MDKDVKEYIMGVMKRGTGGCKHLEMTQALACSTCQMKMVRAQSEYNRLRKEYPEKFMRKEPDPGWSNQVQNMGDMFDERIKQDKLYREHMKILDLGTPEEKRREWHKEQTGFFEKHTEGQTRKIL